MTTLPRDVPVTSAGVVTARTPLDALLRPRSVAVIGASRRPDAIGHQVLANLSRGGFRGALHAVNPHADAVAGVAAVADIEVLRGQVDLAVIAVPARSVADVIGACGRARVPAAVVLSAGFAECGAEGRRREAELREAAARAGVRLVGPNCLGVLNTDPAVRLDATFAAHPPPTGRLAFASQSGAVGLAVFEQAARHGVGLAQFVSLGNSLDLRAAELLAHWGDDASIGAVLLYLETLQDAAQLRAVAERVSRRIPIIALKAGRSEAGARAAASHTGALAGSDAGVDALFRQCGIQRAHTIGEFLDLAQAADRLARPRGRTIAVVTNAGGPGILAADGLAEAELPLATLAAATTARLRLLLPPAAALGNPVDTIASTPAAIIGAALDTVLDDPSTGAAMAICVPPTGMAALDVADGWLAAQARHPAVPLVAVVMGGDDEDAAARRLRAAGVPVHDTPERAACVLAALQEREAWRHRPSGVMATSVPARTAVAVAPAVRNLVPTAGGWLVADRALALLAAAGISVIPSIVAESADAAMGAARAFDGPVAVKARSPRLLHKTEHGAVALALEGDTEVHAAAHAILAGVEAVDPVAAADGLVVQPMAQPGRELIVGVRRDPLLGPLVLLGLGGTAAEALHDVVLRVAPLNAWDAAEMPAELRGAALLGPWRGAPAVDRSALAALLEQVAALALAQPMLEELDLNPVIVSARGVIVVDARARFRAPVHATPAGGTPPAA